MIDTNVIVYARGPAGEASKSERARTLLRGLAASGRGLVSTHVLTEVFDVLARGSRRPDARRQAFLHVGKLATVFPVQPVDMPTLLMAGDCAARHDMRIFDALVWAAAESAGASIVLSEDFTSGRCIGDVRFVDPFSEMFSFADLGLPEPA